VLAATPDPFATSTTEKRAALAHFEPNGVLISRGAARDERRAFNERVLRPDLALHHLAPSIVAAVRDEAARLADAVLDWPHFTEAWWTVIRRVTLGGRARDDHEITDLLGRLRAAGNCAYLRQGHRATRGTVPAPRRRLRARGRARQPRRGGRGCTGRAGRRPGRADTALAVRVRRGRHRHPP
jgi:hypothetical protein